MVPYIDHHDHWSWTYLLALNPWARDREKEAAELLTRLGDRPDFAPFYVARAHLLARVAGRDPEADLRRAVHGDRASRTVRIHLVRHLQQRGHWEQALAASTEGRRLFPGDVNLDLLHVRSLLHLDRPFDAIAILDSTHVLPSETVRTSHRLYAQAHTLASLDDIERNTFVEARRHLLAALEWPEHLEQGRPYDPDERLVRYPLGRVAQQLGQHEPAYDAFRAVVDTRNLADTMSHRLDLLVIPALAALGRTDALQARPYDSATDLGRLAAALTRAVERGDDVSNVMERATAQYAPLFADLDGRLVLQALSVSP